ncbi:hypothetical protein [Acinetobacter sp. MD2(2019)]|uniref:hypothetical protein n=1 Tax=Acinetobacter sp. MD2(2019) TaxID=2605273 RepID=UPI002D1F0056|nr:hypothetical protein [Acinetobacter sp. MD2(2019)]MEB3753847.1 hypothetical protein [Acinetobacter sp. MD2(2019)]
MQTSTLFLLQANFNQATQLLIQLKNMASPSDAVVLMSEAALLVNHPDLALYPLYVLKTEAELLTSTIPDHVSVLDYDQLTDLLLQYSRCISLK